MKKKLISEIRRSLELIYPNNKLIVEKYIPKRLLNEQPGNYFTIVSQALKKIISRGEENIYNPDVLSIEGQSFSKKAIQNIDAAVDLGDVGFTTLTNTERNLAKRLLSIEPEIINQIYNEGLNPFLNAANITEKEFMIEIRDNAKKAGKSVLDYLKGVFNDDFLVDIIEPKISKSIEEIGLGNYIEKLPALIPRNESAIKAFFRRWEPQWIKYFRQRYLISSPIEGQKGLKGWAGEYFKSRKNLTIKMKERLEIIKSKLESTPPQEIDQDLNALANTVGAYSHSTADKIEGLYKTWITENKLIPAEQIEKIGKQSWFKEIIRNQTETAVDATNRAWLQEVDGLFSSFGMNPLSLYKAIKSKRILDSLGFIVPDFRRWPQFILFKNPRLFSQIVGSQTKSGKYGQIAGFLIGYILIDMGLLPLLEATAKTALENNANVNRLNHEIEGILKWCEKNNKNCGDLRTIDHPTLETWKSNYKQSLPFYTWLSDIKKGGSVINEDSFAAQFTYLDEFVNGMSDWILGPGLFNDITKVPDQLRAKWNQHKDTLVQELIGTGFDPTKYKNVDEMLEAFKEFIKKSDNVTPQPVTPKPSQPTNTWDDFIRTNNYQNVSSDTTTGIFIAKVNNVDVTFNYCPVDKKYYSETEICTKCPSVCQ